MGGAWSKDQSTTVSRGAASPPVPGLKTGNGGACTDAQRTRAAHADLSSDRKTSTALAHCRFTRARKLWGNRHTTTQWRGARGTHPTHAAGVNPKTCEAHIHNTHTRTQQPERAGRPPLPHTSEERDTRTPSACRHRSDSTQSTLYSAVPGHAGAARYSGVPATPRLSESMVVRIIASVVCRATRLPSRA